MKKEDLRVKKTKMSLYNGLLELMKDIEFENIKVSDICKKSMINRSTFYDHFNDKFELFQSYIEYVSKNFRDILFDNKNYHDFNEYYLKNINLFLDEIESKTEIYRAIFNNNYNSTTKNMLIDALIKNIMNYLLSNYNIDNEKILKSKVLFYISGSIELVSEELRINKKIDKNRLLFLYKSLIPKITLKKK